MPGKGEKTDPPDDTVVIIVDVRKRLGAIRIFQKHDGEYLGGVRTELTSIPA